jgi:hypothetical protein
VVAALVSLTLKGLEPAGLHRFRRALALIHKIKLEFVLSSMDYTYRERHDEAIYRFKDGMLPSDFFRRNFVLSFQEDAIGIRLRDVIGVDNMMWARTMRTASRRFPNRARSWRRSWPGCRTTNRPRSPAATPPACTISTWRS